MNETKTPTQKAKLKYEKEKRGKVVLRVQLSASDDQEEWERIKNDLVDVFGTAKNGVYELHKNAKKRGVFSK